MPKWNARAVEFFRVTLSNAEGDAQLATIARIIYLSLSQTDLREGNLGTFHRTGTPNH